MGNCCGRQAESNGVELNNIKKNKDQRISRWKATGSVALREANLKELPESVQDLGASVKVLDASKNRIAQLPAWLGTLTNLQRLVLESNKLVTLPPNITNLALLKVLILDSNLLAVLPQRIGRMSALERLSVNNNALSALPEGLGELSRLKVLHCASNKVKELPSTLGACNALEEIDASGNVLEAVPASLSGCKRLKVLTLDNNRIGGFPSSIFTSCGAMHTLSLHGNPITAEVLEESEGYAAFNKRRKQKVDKQIGGGVMSIALDDGIDRPLASKIVTR